MQSVEQEQLDVGTHEVLSTSVLKKQIGCVRQ